MKYYKLVKIDNKLHNDLQYWFKTGRTIIVKVPSTLSNEDKGPTGGRFVELSNVDVLMEVKVNNAIIVTSTPPTIWLPDPEWHERFPIHDYSGRKKP